MSLTYLTRSFRLPLRGLALKGVLNALADHADGQGRCWPSVDRLVLFTGGDAKAVRRALKKLQQLGLLKRRSRPGTSDMFELHLPLPKQAGLPLPKAAGYPSPNRQGNRHEPPTEPPARAGRRSHPDGWAAQP